MLVTNDLQCLKCSGGEGSEQRSDPESRDDSILAMRRKTSNRYCNSKGLTFKVIFKMLDTTNMQSQFKKILIHQLDSNWTFKIK